MPSSAMSDRTGLPSRAYSPSTACAMALGPEFTDTRLHAHGLIAKIPRSRRWRVSLAGRRTMSTAIKLREVAYPSLFAAAA